MDKNTFSFRAECKLDVQRFFNAVEKRNIDIKVTKTIPDEQFPDVEIEFTSTSVLKTLEMMANSMVDGLVIYETLRQTSLSQNSLERNYDKPKPH